MPIKLICVGKNKSGAVKELIDEYIKRIRIYSDIETVIISDTKLTKSNNIEIVVKKESDAIIKIINSKKTTANKAPYFVLLDREGEFLDSLKFSELIMTKIPDNDLSFIIGGVYGVNSEVRKSTDMILSLSSLTFTHQISRILLLEQIYRGLTISNNKKYHY